MGLGEDDHVKGRKEYREKKYFLLCIFPLDPQRESC